jgi:uncharacterized membrane protein HdeD (DUF308 family)
LKFAKFWYLALAIVLIFWGVILLDWITVSSASDILGIGAIVTGVLILIDK